MALTGTLWHLAAAMVVFLVSHGLPARPDWRAATTRRVGETGYVVGYSLMSAAVVIWLAAAYADAPYVEIWPQRPWMRWLPFLAMAAASLLLVAGFTTPNPFSLGPGGRGYDPARPGILRLTRHPVLWALILWSGAHLVPNGDLASLMLFLPLFLLAGVGPALLERKRRRSLGTAWAELAAATGRAPRLALGEIGFVRLAGGAALFLLLLWLHPLIIGVSPLPLALQ